MQRDNQHDDYNPDDLESDDFLGTDADGECSGFRVPESQGFAGAEIDKFVHPDAPQTDSAGAIADLGEQEGLDGGDEYKPGRFANDEAEITYRHRVRTVDWLMAAEAYIFQKSLADAAKNTQRAEDQLWNTIAQRRSRANKSPLGRRISRFNAKTREFEKQGYSTHLAFNMAGQWELANDSKKFRAMAINAFADATNISKQAARRPNNAVKANIFIILCLNSGQSGEVGPAEGHDSIAAIDGSCRCWSCQHGIGAAALEAFADAGYRIPPEVMDEADAALHGDKL